MAANGGGWFSGLGRLLTGHAQSNNNSSRGDNGLTECISMVNEGEAVSHDGNNSHINGSPNGSATNGVRNIRYLSPSVLDSEKNVVQDAPSKDIFSSFGTRKRQLESTSPRTFVQSELTSQGTAKRFRSMGGNFSLLEEPVRMHSEKLDATWAAGPSLYNGSPSSSIRSLRSRISDNTSVSSNGLSSKTRAILQQLEKVCTPAKETRHLPLMKPVDVIKEKWAPLNTSTGPPLRRSTVPSRIQLISSTAGINQRKPYWRDILRKPRSSEPDCNTSQIISLTGDADSSVVHPLFDVSSPVKSKDNAAQPTEKQSSVVPVLKGSNGRNVFNANDLDEDINPTPIPVASLPMPIRDVPKKGFIDDVVFSFAEPTVASIEQKEDADVNDSCEDGSSNGSILSDSDDSDSSSDDDTVRGSKGKISSDNKEISRPPTSADTDSSTVRSGSPLSSKSSPVTGAASVSWDCPNCFISNTTPACVCCQYVNGGSSKSADAPAQKVLVSNLDSFAPKSKSGFTFGFGSGPANNSEASKSNETVKISGVPVATKIANGDNQTLKKTTSEAVAPLAPTTNSTAAASTTAPWTCPDCFVSNTGHKCLCCGHVNASVTPPIDSSASAFGDRAFKPATTGATGSFSFGLSNGSSKPVASGNDSISSPTSKPLDAAGFAANIFGATAKAPLFGIEKSSTEKSLFGVQSSPLATTTSSTVQEKPPLFGAGSTLFAKSGDSSISLGNAHEKKTSESSENVKPATTIFDSSKPLFGSTSTSSNLFGQNDLKVVSGAATTSPSFFGTTDNEISKISDVGKPSSLTGFGAIPSVPMFGAQSSAGKDSSASTTAPPSLPATSSIPSSVNSVFGSGTPAASSSANSLFGSAATAASSSASSLFGSAATSAPSSVPMFGSLSNTSLAPTTNLFGSVTPAAAIATPQFGASATPAPLFGSATTSSQSTFSLGGAKPAQNLFGAPSSTGCSLFSATKTDDAPPSKSSKMATFGNSDMSGGSLFGNSTGFSGSSTGSGFGSFSGPVPPVLPSSSSASSLFPSSVPSNSAFTFGSTEAPSTFNFGGAPTADVSSVFASAPQPVAAPGGFAFSANSAAPGGAFAFNASASTGTSMSSNARKMVAARRRLPQRK